VEGTGEKLTVIPVFPLLHAVLVNPGVAVSTDEAYRTAETKSGTGRERPATFRDASALIGFLETTRNDLGEPAIRLAPVICEVMAALCEEETTLLARMSGSGATCFGLYGSPDAAAAMAAKIAKANPSWWVKAVRLGSA
jgi:4-diphosphocytidyl-2-C-methyl-D-erythritol kinase